MSSTTHKVVPTMANVSGSLALGGTMATAFRNSLPTGFHAKLSSPVNIMEHLKRGVNICDKIVFDGGTVRTTHVHFDDSSSEQ